MTAWADSVIQVWGPAGVFGDDPSVPWIYTHVEQIVRQDSGALLIVRNQDDVFEEICFAPGEWKRYTWRGKEVE